MNTKLNVEGKELAIINDNGDIAIIPVKYKREVEDMVAENCFKCVDALVSTLPQNIEKLQTGGIIQDKTGTLKEDLEFFEDLTTKFQAAQTKEETDALLRARNSYIFSKNNEPHLYDLDYMVYHPTLEGVPIFKFSKTALNTLNFIKEQEALKAAKEKEKEEKQQVVEEKAPTVEPVIPVIKTIAASEGEKRYLVTMPGLQSVEKEITINPENNKAVTLQFHKTWINPETKLAEKYTLPSDKNPYKALSTDWIKVIENSPEDLD